MDLDLEKFFDHVNHDILMQQLRKLEQEKLLLQLIGRYLRVAPTSVKRFREKVRQHCARGRGRNLRRFIAEELNPFLNGWAGYFKASETRGIFDELDQWIRRRLRNILWRQWKRPRTRRKKLMGRGLSEETASKSAYNGRGAWWNSGASHMNYALPKKYFDQLGLVNLQQRVRFLEQISS